jgi:hypothetical protein
LAQLLVVQYAVSESRVMRARYPNELVGDRFIVFGSESPELGPDAKFKRWLSQSK